MKKLIPLLTALLIVSIALAQDESIIDSKFKLTQNVKLHRCDGVGDTLGFQSSEILEQEFLITVGALSEDKKSYVIYVDFFGPKYPKYNLKYVGSTEQPYTKKKNAIDTAAPGDYFYFLFPIDRFTTCTQKPVSNKTLVLGIPTIPAKLRFGMNRADGERAYFRFEGDVSLGLSIGYRWSPRSDHNYGVIILTGFTIASVQVDSATTRGKVSDATTAASFSPHVGLVADLKKIQLGLYTGIDFLYGSLNSTWVYRNTPWLGVGIGYSLFSVSSKKQVKKD